MAQTARSAFPADDPVRSRGKDGARNMEKSFRKCVPVSPGLRADEERSRFARLLWRAFPEAGSENELAALAAEVLTSDHAPVTARAVRNWLRCENTPHFRYVLRVIALVGAEAVFQLIDPEVGA